MKRYQSVCLLLVSLMPLAIFAEKPSSLKTQQEELKIEAGRIFIAYDENEAGQRAYISAVKNEQANSEFDVYTDYKIHFPNGTKSKPLSLWSGTDFQFYLSPSGKGYLIVTYIDGGWAIFANREEYDFSWGKPWVKKTKDSLVVVYGDKYGKLFRVGIK